MSEPVIRLRDIGKAYRIWNSPAARLGSLGLHAVKHMVPAFRDRCNAAQAKLYRDFYALRGVGFELRRGETLGIIGRNGSGKSTLLQIISGTLVPNTGTVEVNGRVAALLELGSGFNPEFTGRENVFLNGAILGLSETEMETRFAAIEAFADIGDFIDQPVKTYSSGMVLRLAFAVVAHVDADILIVDEALAVGDAFFVQKCMRWIREFKERGTLLFVAHNAAEVVALCDRALWLRNGAVAFDDSAKRVTEEYLAFFQTEQIARKDAAVPGPKPSPEAATPSANGVPETGSSRFENPARGLAASFNFDPTKAGYGEGKAKIVGVEFFLTDHEETTLLTIVGGERVTLRITAMATEEIANPILGFYLKDRLGQYLFGDNTYYSNLNRELNVTAGGIVTAEFSFQMPALPRGQYMFALAMASGTQNAHVQQHWVYDALELQSTNESSHRGLVGIPIERIFTTIAAGPLLSTPRPSRTDGSAITKEIS